jgi:hypothetical protein
MELDRQEFTTEELRLPTLQFDAVGLLSRVWKCSNCGQVHAYADPVHMPTPCTKCDGIVFEKR